VHTVFDARRGTVGDHLPVRGRGHRDVEHGLEIGLVEAGEHPLGVGGLELGVQIHRFVDRVDEAVQALTGVGVAAVCIDDHDVVLGQAAQRNTGRFVVRRDVDAAAVESGAVHRVRGDVDDGLGAGQGVEFHGRR
jgi:hypothetical protein